MIISIVIALIIFSILSFIFNMFCAFLFAVNELASEKKHHDMNNKIREEKRAKESRDARARAWDKKISDQKAALKRREASLNRWVSGTDPRN